ncbi:MAG: acyl-CoA thioesterase/BAAT N-terminal domain-containing protein [Sphingomonadaceae bacterium]|nr:acyl-CoA thioesterase/BAAT N-terminal domain-containing protein [Sphingomonadaceae bacterium]
MPFRLSRCILFALPLILPTAAHAASVKLILPPDLSAPRPAPIRVTGLPPSATVTLTTIQQRDRDERFEAAVTFRATSAGTVDTARQAPIAGSYTGVEPLGAFWSGIATKNTPAASQAPSIGYARVTVRMDGREIAAGTVRIRPDPAIRLSTATPFPGAVWARPADRRRHPVVILLGGSEGGSSTARAMAPLFAARG